MSVVRPLAGWVGMQGTLSTECWAFFQWGLPSEE